MPTARSTGGRPSPGPSKIRLWILSWGDEVEVLAPAGPPRRRRGDPPTSCQRVTAEVQDRETARPPACAVALAAAIVGRPRAGGVDHRQPEHRILDWINAGPHDRGLETLAGRPPASGTSPATARPGWPSTNVMSHAIAGQPGSPAERPQRMPLVRLRRGHRLQHRRAAARRRPTSCSTSGRPARRTGR